MSLSPPILLTLIALAAVLIARRGIAATARRSSVAARLRMVYGLVGLLLLLRLLYAWWMVPPVASLVMVAAAWLPVAMLRVAEELVRRHAPRVVKLASLAGAVGFSVLAVTFGLVWSGAAVAALAGFQTLAIIAIIVLLMRNRGDVSLSERRAVDLFVVALLLAMPLVLTDFQKLFPDLPVRAGGFAVLILILATSRLVAGQGRPRQLLGDLLLALAAGGIAALTLSTLPGGPTDLLPVVVCAAAGAVLLMLIERFAGGNDAGPDLVSALVAVEHRRSAMLAAHPLLDRGVLVESEALSDYPPAVIRQLAEYRLISGGLDHHDPSLTDATADLLGHYAASHLIRLSQQPPRFLAVSAGGLADTALDEQLELAARLLEGAE